MPQHRCFPRARAFREGFPVDESYPVGHVTKRAGLEMRTMEEEAVGGGAGAGQMAPSGGAASFPLWLLLRGGGTAVLLLHTVDLIGIVRSALLLLFHHRSAVSVSSMESLHCLRGRIRLLRWMDRARSLRSRMRSTTFGRAIC